MAIISIVASLLLVSIIAAVSALPARFAREVAEPTLVLNMQPEPSSPTLHTGRILGECFDVSHVDTPKKIRLHNSNVDSLQITTYSQPCSAPIRPKIESQSFDGSIGIEVNKREPICSFRLGANHRRNVTVKLGGFTGTTKSASVCMSSCSSSNASSSKYAESVELYMNNRLTKQSDVTLFSDKDCTSPIPKLVGVVVVSGTDLVTPTRVDPDNRVVRSFIISRV